MFTSAIILQFDADSHDQRHDIGNLARVWTQSSSHPVYATLALRLSVKCTPCAEHIRRKMTADAPSNSRRQATPAVGNPFVLRFQVRARVYKAPMSQNRNPLSRADRDRAVEPSDGVTAARPLSISERALRASGGSSIRPHIWKVSILSKNKLLSHLMARFWSLLVPAPVKPAS